MRAAAFRGPAQRLPPRNRKHGFQVARMPSGLKNAAFHPDPRRALSFSVRPSLCHVLFHAEDPIGSAPVLRVAVTVWVFACRGRTAPACRASSLRGANRWAEVLLAARRAWSRPRPNTNRSEEFAQAVHALKACSAFAAANTGQREDLRSPPQRGFRPSRNGVGPTSMDPW